ncbi:hypothetical protein FRB98_004115 [Tulasnella sp. 332]|nr:hypothetical protein FRB98_004115 [Tulasnella sp. 332]
MDSIYPLLEILSPLTIIEETWHFTPNLSLGNWDRFNNYSNRIRAITHDDNKDFRTQSGTPSRNLFTDITAHWGLPQRTTLLPNLFSLGWTSNHRISLSLLLNFISPTITTLDISCHQSAARGCGALFQDLMMKKISLLKITLDAEGPGQDYIPHLSTFLGSQTALIEARLPPFSATVGLVSALGRLPSLKAYSGWSLVDYQEDGPQGSKCFKWEPGTFEVLEELSFHAWPSLLDAAVVLEHVRQSKLCSIYLTHRAVWFDHQLRTLTSVLATVHCNLTSITLAFFAGADVYEQLDSLDFNHIRPLLQCKALSILRIGHERTISYNKEDILVMASSWPSMEVLELFKDPVIAVGSQKGQPLQSVREFVRQIPTLTELGIYVDVVGALPELQSVPIAHGAKLKILDFGTSPGTNDDLQAEKVISLYLASSTGPESEIRGYRSDGHLRAVWTGGEGDEEYGARGQFWSDIDAKVNLVHMARAHMDEDMRALARHNLELLKQVEELRHSLAPSHSKSLPLMIPL